jgi:hypothetical protein
MKLVRHRKMADNVLGTYVVGLFQIERQIFLVVDLSFLNISEENSPQPHLRPWTLSTAYIVHKKTESFGSCAFFCLQESGRS